MARAIRVIETASTWAVVDTTGPRQVVLSHHATYKAAARAATVERAKHPAAVMLGRMGGRATSPAKAEAARTNGALGGRPRKVVAS